MPVKLHIMDLSPPVAAATMICEIHNVPVEIIKVDLISRDNHSPEYLKLQAYVIVLALMVLQKNPMHTIPVLEDGDFILHDSHAILTYINERYGKDDSLYPKDVKQRALVDQKLFFDTLLFSRLRSITYASLIEGVRKPPSKLLKELDDAYGFLEAFLSNTKFVAGDTITLADISVVATVSAMRHVISIDPVKYPKINAWFAIMEKQPFFQKCAAPGSEILRDLLEKNLDI